MIPNAILGGLFVGVWLRRWAIPIVAIGRAVTIAAIVDGPVQLAARPPNGPKEHSNAPGACIPVSGVARLVVSPGGTTAGSAS